MKILLTNDDGYQAIGIRTLAEELSKTHEIYLVAPDTERSGASQSATYFSQDLTVTKQDIPGVKEAYSVSGTPADCAYVGVNFLLKEKMDLVISGINKGWNVSKDCFYSGTVGAAREAIFMGVASIAVSLGVKNELGRKLAVKMVEDLIPVYMNDENRFNYILNINVPNLDISDCKGIMVTEFEPEWKYINTSEKTEIDENKFKIRITGTQMHGNILTDSIQGDASACHNGYVSVTPLSLNMHAGDYQKSLEAHINTKFENKK